MAINVEPPRRFGDEPQLLITLSDERAQLRAGRDARWIKVLASELAGDSRPKLQEFLTTFGPCEPPRPSSVRALGRLWSQVSDNSLWPVADLLAARYPTAEAGLELKLALFGQSDDWWQLPEAYRLAVLTVRSGDDAWPMRTLEVMDRIAALAQAGALPELLTVLGTEPSTTGRALLFDALRRVATPAIAEHLSAHSSDWGADFVGSTPLIRDRAAWGSLTDQGARRLLANLQGADDAAAIAAAITSPHAAEAVRQLPPATLRRAVASLDAVTIRGLVGSDAVAELVATAQPLDVLRFDSAGAPVTHDQRRAALSATRQDADEVWLRLAARALVADREALAVVFGPLHFAITEDRLPHELWNEMDETLPPDEDPARRLRRLLIQRVESDRWSQRDVLRALRGAGPHAAEVLRDMDDSDPLTKTVRKVLKRLRRRDR
jgi:hypothetical protein